MKNPYKKSNYSGPSPRRWKDDDGDDSEPEWVGWVKAVLAAGVLAFIVYRVMEMAA